MGRTRIVRPDHIEGQRQRTDGTWTFTTEAWDAKHYFPVGTRVSVETVDGPVTGTVEKDNTTTCRLRFDDEKWQRGAGHRLIPHRLLSKL